MRNTWLSPRSAIWEYWTSLIACLFWIQYSCGMPHVIRIGKFFPFAICNYTHKHTHIYPLHTNIYTRARLYGNLHIYSPLSWSQCGSAATLSFRRRWAAPFIYHSPHSRSEWIFIWLVVEGGRGREQQESGALCFSKTEDAFTTLKYCGLVWPLCTLLCLFHFLQPACWVTG